MWPWEHLAFGYLAYSALARLAGRRPGDRDAVALALATQLPDLVDKPLAWWLGALPSGLSLAHSLVVGLPVCLAVLALARRAGAGSVGLAYCVGYCSHLAGDVLYPLVTDGDLRVDFLLWPLVGQSGTSAPGLLAQLVHFLGEYRAFLATPRGQLYVAVELAFLGAAVAVWITDGYPGVPGPRRLAVLVTRRVRRDGR